MRAAYFRLFRQLIRYCEVQAEHELPPGLLQNSTGPTSVILEHEKLGRESVTLDKYFVTKDDDDQEENNEVYFTITSTAEQESARAVHGDE